MRSVGLLLGLVPVAVVLAVGVALVLGGTAMSRRARDARGLVEVEGVVVERTSFSDPARLTFDYPLPDGSWARATRVEGLPSPGERGAARRPGERVTVLVDPHRPADVRLPGARSAAGLGGALLVGVGVVACLGALLLGGILLAGVVVAVP